MSDGVALFTALWGSWACWLSVFMWAMTKFAITWRWRSWRWWEFRSRRVQTGRTDLRIPRVRFWTTALMSRWWRPMTRCQDLMNVFCAKHVTQVFVSHFAVDGFSKVEFSNLKKFRADVFRSEAGNGRSHTMESSIAPLSHDFTRRRDVRRKGIKRLVRFLYSFIQDIPFVRYIDFSDAEIINSLDYLADVLSVVVRGKGHGTEYVVGVGADAREKDLSSTSSRLAGQEGRSFVILPLPLETSPVEGSVSFRQNQRRRHWKRAGQIHRSSRNFFAHDGMIELCRNNNLT